MGASPLRKIDTMASPWTCPIYRLIREFAADKGLPPTPSACALRAYLEGKGRLQVGSRFADVGMIWLRPLGQGRWYVDKPC